MFQKALDEIDQLNVKNCIIQQSIKDYIERLKLKWKGKQKKNFLHFKYQINPHFY